MTDTDRVDPKATTAAPLSATRLAAVPMMAGVGVLIGSWVAASIFVGPQLDLGPRRTELEFADHVLPGAVVIVICLAVTLALFVGKRFRPAAASLLFYAGLGISLAGVWTTATHVPLVLQALRDQAPWPAALNYSIPAFAMLLFGIGWLFVYRGPYAAPAEQTA